MIKKKKGEELKVPLELMVYGWAEKRPSRVEEMFIKTLQIFLGVPLQNFQHYNFLCTVSKFFINSIKL